MPAVRLPWHLASPALAGLAALGLSAAANAGGSYVEGRLGAIGLDDLSGTGIVDSTIGFARLEGDVAGHLSYDDTFVLGAEFGVEAVFGTSLRLAASLDGFQPDLGNANLDADLTINGVDVPDTPDNSPLTADAVTDLGLDFNHRTVIASGNAFLDLDLGAIVPYVGVGYGVLLVENANQYETGFLLHAGIRYDATPLTYIGARFTWYRGNGPQDDTGVNFDTFETQALAVSIGVKL